MTLSSRNFLSLLLHHHQCLLQCCSTKYSSVEVSTEFTILACYYLKEHSGVRKIVGFTACVARASATALSFCYALLLLSVCRNVTTMLRNTVVGSYIPFDSSIAFHRLVAWVSLFFTGIHCLCNEKSFHTV